MTIVGTEYDDSLYGNSENDVIAGLEGDDLILGNGGDDTLYGGVDNELDSLVVGGGDDTLLGGEGNDLIVNSFGNNELYGELGDDTLLSKEDFMQAMGNNSIDGGEGTDTVIYSNAEVDINLARGNARIYNNFFQRNDTLINIENIEVSGESSRIIGNWQDNRIYGTNGNDSIYGVGGDDTVNGFNGEDILSGDRGNDLIIGGLGGDIFMGTSSRAKGAGEIDVLKKVYVKSSFSEQQTDVFVLGSRNDAYYTAVGNEDYAEIINFQSGIDRLMLSGSADDYEVEIARGETRLSYNESGNSDLIAILKSNTDLDLNRDATFMS